MRQTIRFFLLFEAATFIIASLAHSGVLVTGYEHRAARIAEGVIAAVLVIGLLVSWIRPAWTRAAGLAAQTFSLLGTLVGVFTIIIGVGPQTVSDVVYHVFIIVVLAWGLVVAARARPGLEPD
ncbi:MAG TPA: hypothetical protein VFG50_08355 [Rhodothermales bacterium]|nr:hypothetical protein [Rhodothermales bacterium]